MNRKMHHLTRIALICALPLALTLSACAKKDGTAAASDAPLAKIAAPAGKAWTDVVSQTPDGGYLMGNPAAPIKLIEYGSLTCPHCAHLAQAAFAKLTGDYVASGRVSFEYRSFAIHGPDVPLTVLAGCGSPEAFIPRIEQVYANFDSLIATAQKGEKAAQAAMALPDSQRFAGVADAMGFTAFFAARGVSKDQAHACLGNIAAATAVAKHAEDYSKAGIDSTPSLLINGVKIAGTTWAELEPALQRAGAR